MTRTLVIGDIHGGLKGLIQVIKRANISEKDTLIFIGDYGDGWSETAGVFHYLMLLDKTHSCIFIRGNHDYLVHRHLKFNELNPLWLNHGGIATLESYTDVSKKKKKAHIFFLESLHDYYTDNKNRLFVHAGFTNPAGPENEFYPNMVFWDRTLWETAYSMDPRISKNDIRYPKRLKIFKEIYIGHTPTTRLGKSTPLNFNSVWNVDTGAAFKGCITVLDVDTKKFWQSDPLHELYPDERGRN
jgi:serine/threonine protein phosphatase 1